MTDHPPSPPEGAAEDPYSRVDYRRLIAWPQRIERERPFLERLLAAAPRRRVLDLGCGTGEHARFFAGLGCDTIGIDASPSMLARAGEEPLPPNLRFVLGDMVDLERLVDGELGLAVCLGNALPHLRQEEALARLLAALARRLAAGGLLCLQVLNYERLFTGGERYLPLNFRQDDEGTVIFLRLMDPRPDGSVLFNPTTLRYRPGEEPPVEVLRTKNVELRGWRRGELERQLAGAGFGGLEVFGGMRGEPYEAANSQDLVLVARRS